MAKSEDAFLRGVCPVGVFLTIALLDSDKGGQWFSSVLVLT